MVSSLRSPSLRLDVLGVIASSLALPASAAVVDLHRDLAVSLRWKDAPSFGEIADDFETQATRSRSLNSLPSFQTSPVEHVGAMVNRFFGGLNLEVPDNSSVGTTSERVVEGISGVIASVQVRLDIAPASGSTMFNGDYRVSLTHGSGMAVLLNRTGRRDGFSAGYGDNGFQVTLSDGAAADIHTYRTTATGSHTTPLSNTDTPIALTGTWQPDGRSADPGQVVIGSPRDAMLSQFAGMDPNGVWTLHVADLAEGGQGRLVEWSLHFTLVPEPDEVVLGSGVLLGLYALARFRTPRCCR
ncbi:MAG: proprotein convertase P-domain-containing protein [Verrucomicrobiales bacterium]|nr:proprotein convertase P-domain-containing protein [Verrucomicrobiales bacterium]